MHLEARRIDEAYITAQKEKEEKGRDYNAPKAKSTRTDGDNSGVKANALTTGGDTSVGSKDADDILKRYYDLDFQSTHITIDDEGMDARANQMELDTSPMEISRTNLPFHFCRSTKRSH